MSFDLIVGYHSIHHALENTDRANKEIFATKEGLKKYKSKYQINESNVQFLDQREIRSVYTKHCVEKGFNSTKLHGDIFLISDELPELGNAFLYSLIEKKESLRLLALDRVTDIHNAAAILRTAAFYNLDGLILSQKSTLSYTPGFFRIASGGFEHVPVMRTPNLSKTLKTLSSKQVTTIGLSEEVENSSLEQKSSWCLVLGSEEMGLSHAVERSVDEHICLKSHGKIDSLNVSIAASIALEKFTH